MLRRRAAEKLKKVQIGYNLDIVRNSFLKTKVGPQLFEVTDMKNGIEVGNQDLSFWSKTPVVRIGTRDFNMWQALVVICVVYAMASQFKLERIKLGIVLIPIIVLYFMTYETQRFRCHGMTTTLALVFSTLVLLRDQLRSADSALNALATFFLLFYTLHALDT